MKKPKDGEDPFEYYYYRAVKGMADVEKFCGSLDSSKRGEGRYVAVNGMAESMAWLIEDFKRWVGGALL